MMISSSAQAIMNELGGIEFPAKKRTLPKLIPINQPNRKNTATNIILQRLNEQTTKPGEELINKSNEEPFELQYSGESE